LPADEDLEIDDAWVRQSDVSWSQRGLVED